MKLSDKIAKCNDNLTVNMYDNGFMIEVSGRDNEDDWATTKILCSTFEQVVEIIKEIPTLCTSNKHLHLYLSKVFFFYSINSFCYNFKEVLSCRAFYFNTANNFIFCIVNYCIWRTSRNFFVRNKTAQSYIVKCILSCKEIYCHRLLVYATLHIFSYYGILFFTI